MIVREFDGAHVEGIDLGALDAAEFWARNSRFEDCRLGGLSGTGGTFGAGLRPTIYVDCSFDGARIESNAPGRARFERCSFEDVLLRGWICMDCEFVDCTFSGRGERMVFYGSRPRPFGLGTTENAFRGNDFSRMQLRDVAFRGGIDLTQQKFDLSEDFILLDPVATIDRASEIVRAWTDEGDRKVAEMILHEDLEGELSIGGRQEQLLIRPAEMQLQDEQAIAVVRLLRELGRTKPCAP